MVFGSNYSVKFQGKFSDYFITGGASASDPIEVTDNGAYYRDGATIMNKPKYLIFMDLTLDISKISPNTAPANDISYAGTSSGANHFIDYLNFAASYPDLINAFGANQQAI